MFKPRSYFCRMTRCMVAVILLGYCRDGEALCDAEHPTSLNATTKSKTFDSPDFPNPYPSNANCSWLLSGPDENYLVRVDTISIFIEDSQGCAYDSIYIFDGKTIYAPLILKYCRGLVSTYSSGEHMLILFRTDNSIQKTGFRLRYTAVSLLPPTVPTVMTITSSVSTVVPSSGGSMVSTGILIGAITGGIIIVIVIGSVCGRCMRKSRPRRPPEHRPAAYFHTHIPPTTTEAATSGISGAVHMVQNNNAVFMMSQGPTCSLPPPGPVRFTPHYNGGITNMAYRRSREFSSFPPGHCILGRPIGDPPPTYNESMLYTHPPALPPSPRHAYAAVPGSSLLHQIAPLLYQQQNTHFMAGATAPSMATAPGEAAFNPAPIAPFPAPVALPPLTDISANISHYPIPGAPYYPMQDEPSHSGIPRLSALLVPGVSVFDTASAPPLLTYDRPLAMGGPLSQQDGGSNTSVSQEFPLADRHDNQSENIEVPATEDDTARDLPLSVADGLTTSDNDGCGQGTLTPTDDEVIREGHNSSSHAGAGAAASCATTINENCIDTDVLPPVESSAVD